MKDLMIIGTGPAGLTAAIYAGYTGFRPVIATGHLPGGLLTPANEDENFPEPVNGFEWMDTEFYLEKHY